MLFSQIQRVLALLLLSLLFACSERPVPAPAEPVQKARDSEKFISIEEQEQATAESIAAPPPVRAIPLAPSATTYQLELEPEPKTKPTIEAEPVAEIEIPSETETPVANTTIEASEETHSPNSGPSWVDPSSSTTVAVTQVLPSPSPSPSPSTTSSFQTRPRYDISEQADVIRAAERLGTVPETQKWQALGRGYDYDQIPFQPNDFDQRRVLDSFFENGQPSLKKFIAFQDQINARHKIAFRYLTAHYQADPNQPRSRGQAEAIAGHNQLLQVYRIIDEKLEELRSVREREPFIRQALLVLELNDSIKEMGYESQLSDYLFNTVPSNRITWKINKKAGASAEAKNLFHPGTGRTYQESDLSKLLDDRVDLSRINPHPRSGTWIQHQEIAGLNIENNYYQQPHPLYDSSTLAFPQENLAKLVNLQASTTHPIINASFVDEAGVIRPLKIKVGARMHSEVTVGALMAALGYATDINRYVRHFKLYLPENMSPKYFKELWNAYYAENCEACPLKYFNADRHISRTGKDENGHYLVLTESLLEAQVPEQVRVGPFSYTAHGHSNEREIRAMLLFNMWVNNTDIRSQNTLMVMRKNHEGRYLPYYLQHELGGSLGELTEAEKPNQFRAELISEVDNEAIYFNYQTAHGLDRVEDDGVQNLLDTVTYHDAKWMARLIGQLTKEQILKAIEMGGWPQQAGQIYLEKLINRRNQLMKAFELYYRGSELEVPYYVASNEIDYVLPTEHEYDPAEVVREILSAKIKQKLEGFTQDFHEFDPKMANPFAEAFMETAALLGQSVLSGIGTIAVNLDAIGLDYGVVAQVIFEMDRDIFKNESPKGAMDAYLLQDSFKIGLRLGYSLVIGADVAYWQHYKLVQPVRSERAEGDVRRGIVNLALPFQANWFGGLPTYYSLSIENFYEVRGRIKFEDLLAGFSPIGYQSAASRFNVMRAVYQHNLNGDLIFYGDNRTFMQSGQNIYFNAIFAKLPFYNFTYDFEATLKGEMRIIKAKTLEKEGQKLEKLLAKAIDEADYKPLYPYSQLVKVKSDYEELTDEFNLLGIVYWGHKERTDQITIQYSPSAAEDESQDQDQDQSPAQDLVRYRLQHRSDRYEGWAFPFFGSEDRLERTQAMGESTKDFKKLLDPTLHLYFFLDDTKTYEDELGLGYVSFLNSLVADQRNRVPYLPKLENRNGRFGNVVLRANLFYSPEGMRKILSMTANDFWRMVADENTMHPLRLEYYRWSRFKNYEPGLRKPIHKYDIDKYPVGMFETVKRGYAFLEELRYAQQIFDSQPKESIKALVDAMEKLIFERGHYIDGTLLGALNAYVGVENFYFWGEIGTPKDKKSHMLDQKDYRITDGQYHPQPFEVFITFNPTRANDQWHMFDWVEAL